MSTRWFVSPDGLFFGMEVVRLACVILDFAVLGFLELADGAGSVLLAARLLFDPEPEAAGFGLMVFALDLVKPARDEEFLAEGSLWPELARDLACDEEVALLFRSFDERGLVVGEGEPVTLPMLLLPRS